MKQNKDREEFENIFYTQNGYLREDVPDLIEEIWKYFETHTQKKVEEEHQKLLDILKHNKDDMTGLYDYDGVAEDIINLVKK